MPQGFSKALKKVNAIDDEPMVNIAGFYEEGKGRGGKWQLTISHAGNTAQTLFLERGC